MDDTIKLKRTDSDDPGFQLLISHLDHELWNELKEDQSLYEQFNKVPNLSTVIVALKDGVAIACGCFKHYATGTVEIKRMFVEKEYRGQGISRLILFELESWAKEHGYKRAILETSVHFSTARSLYRNAGYVETENYGQYSGLAESVCMMKEL
jgi:GNAT superfamily N-acetyltransferase